MSASIIAILSVVNGAPRAGVASCHASSLGSGDGRRAPPAGEIWLSDEDLHRMQVSTEEVALHDVDETLLTVGPVLSSDDCPVPQAPEEPESCILVAVDQASLGRVHLGTTATARASSLVHDVFAGRVAWIAGALDPSGRTARVACLFADPMAELRPGKQVRVEVVVGARPAFAVSRSAVVQARGESFVFAATGTATDGRHKFARVTVRPDRDTGGPWLPLADLQPGSFVVKSGAQSLASMLAVTTL